MDLNTITWDQSGSYVLASGGRYFLGGIGVLQFDGSALTQTFHPAEDFGVQMYPRQVHNLVFALSTFIIPHFDDWIGYTQQDGTVTIVEGCCPFNPTYSIAIY